MKHGKSILLLGTLLITVNFLPTAAYGQTNPLAPVQQGNPSVSPLKALNLTPEQQKQLDNIRLLLQAEMRTILSTEQFERLRAMQDAGQEPKLSSVKLSKSQKKKLREAQDLAAYRLSLLLTPDQQRQLGDILRSQR